MSIEMTFGLADDDRVIVASIKNTGISTDLFVVQVTDIAWQGSMGGATGEFRDDTTVQIPGPGIQMRPRQRDTVRLIEIDPWRPVPFMQMGQESGYDLVMVFGSGEPEELAVMQGGTVSALVSCLGNNGSAEATVTAIARDGKFVVVGKLP